MYTQKRSKLMYLAALAVIFGGILLSTLAIPQSAQAYCDSEKGPVASAAHQALESGNGKLILPYVKPEAETELVASFKQAIVVRKVGGSSRELADRYFIETAIRLHRASEGAPFTGVSDESTPQAILVADKAMATGSLDETYKLLDEAIKKDLREKYEAVVKVREEAEHLGTVEAHRERVEADLIFEKYIYELSTVASAEQPAAEGHTH